MATKTAVKTVEYTNGDVPSFAPSVHKLTGFQARYMQRLIANFDKAREAVQAIQASANDFILACAEEEGVTLGQDGWQFDQEALEFIQVAGVTDGDNTRPE